MSLWNFIKTMDVENKFFGFIDILTKGMRYGAIF